MSWAVGTTIIYYGEQQAWFKYVDMKYAIYTDGNEKRSSVSERKQQQNSIIARLWLTADFDCNSSNKAQGNHFISMRMIGMSETE